MRKNDAKVFNSWGLSKLALVGLCGLAALAIAVSGCGSSSSTTESTQGGSLKSVSLRLDWAPQGYQAPFYAAKALGYYEKAGLDVDVQSGQGTSTTIKLVANGSDDFGFGQLSEVAFSRTEHEVPLKAIAGVFQQMPDTVFVRADSGIESVSELPGKSLVTSAGDSSNEFFPALAAANGFNADEVNFLTTSSETKEQVFLGGKGDGLLDFSVAQFLLEREGTPVKAFPYAENGVNLISQGLFTSDDEMENESETAAFVKASMEGLAFAKANPKKAAAFVVEANEKAIDQEQAETELKATLPLMETEATKGKPLGYMAPTDWEKSVELMEKYLEMKEEDPANLYTNQFIGKE